MQSSIRHFEHTEALRCKAATRSACATILPPIGIHPRQVKFCALAELTPTPGAKTWRPDPISRAAAASSAASIPADVSLSHSSDRRSSTFGDTSVSFVVADGTNGRIPCSSQSRPSRRTRAHVWLSLSRPRSRTASPRQSRRRAGRDTHRRLPPRLALAGTHFGPHATPTGDCRQSPKGTGAASSRHQYGDRP